MVHNVRIDQIHDCEKCMSDLCNCLCLCRTTLGTDTQDGAEGQWRIMQVKVSLSLPFSLCCQIYQKEGCALFPFL